MIAPIVSEDRYGGCAAGPAASGRLVGLATHDKSRSRGLYFNQRFSTLVASSNGEIWPAHSNTPRGETLLVGSTAAARSYDSFNSPQILERILWRRQL
jgi:hypothetical protein